MQEKSYDLIIVGGGVHGTILSNLLTASGAFDRQRLVVIDDRPRPMDEWFMATERIGMKYLRSPSSHNLEAPLQSLVRYASTEGRRDDSKDHRKGRGRAEEFIGPYLRPSLDLFNAHAASTIAKRGLEALRLHRRVRRVEIERDRIVAITQRKAHAAKYMLLAVGSEGSLEVPDWAINHSTIRHIFDPDYDVDAFLSSTNPVIVGGGISAVQLALRHKQARVRIISPHPVRIAQFDSEPCYIGPDCLGEFAKTKGAEIRGRVIDAARHPGSIPPDLAADFDESLRKKQLQYHVGAIVSVDGEHGRYRLEVKSDGDSAGTVPRVERFDTDSITLATGFTRSPPRKGLISEIAREYSLPIDAVGRPIPDESLRWTERLFVSGRAGEMSLGPAAPNIIGAHLAARRLVPYFIRGKSRREDPWTPLAI